MLRDKRYERGREGEQILEDKAVNMLQSEELRSLYSSLPRVCDSYSLIQNHSLTKPY